MARHSLFIYGSLLTAWALVMVWQVAEHSRVQKSARAELIFHAKDISITLGIVLRSQKRFGGGVISKERLESALAELVRPGELNSIALLNTDGDMVASAGVPVDLQHKDPVRSAELWEDQTVTLVNLVDLGAHVTGNVETPNPPAVVSPQDFARPAASPPEIKPDEVGTTNTVDSTPSTISTSQPKPHNANDGRLKFSRPSWMTNEEFNVLIQKQSVHSFMIVLSTQSIQTACNQDLWMRSIIGTLAAIAAVGLGLAWHNLGKSMDLQVRLVRASEWNSHLKGMNLVAAGLAHETRNPLNIIRGLAQMISKQPDTPLEIRKKSTEIIDEADRVTAQLNEFINYSRPRELHRTAIALNTLTSEVVRTLSHDTEEKKIQIQITGNPLMIEADEQLLRQALFNLLINAIQAVPISGEIQIFAQKSNSSEAFFEIRDTGPGVPVGHRTEIFKPYFTTQQKGTGLGLAVVQQIVLAHGWEIECLANEPNGTTFRITHLKLTA